LWEVSYADTVAKKRLRREEVDFDYLFANRLQRAGFPST
jgi:hypothetical protein